MYLRCLTKYLEQSEYPINSNYNDIINNDNNNTWMHNTTRRQVEDTTRQWNNWWPKEAGRKETQNVGECTNLCRKRDSFTQQHASSTYCVSGTPPNIGNPKENKKNTISAHRELTASRRRPTVTQPPQCGTMELKSGLGENPQGEP